MNKLDKLKTLLKVIEDNNITAYEIGKYTKISTFAIQKIIKGETKKPNDLTINAIEEFLENAIVGTNIKNKTENFKLQEPETEYKFSENSNDLVSQLQAIIKTQDKNLKEAYLKIGKLEDLLIKNNIDF